MANQLFFRKSVDHELKSFIPRALVANMVEWWLLCTRDTNYSKAKLNKSSFGLGRPNSKGRFEIRNNYVKYS